MNLVRYGHVILLLSVALTFVVTDGRRCRKKDPSKCKGKRDRLSKPRAIRSDKAPAAPRWKKRTPKDANQAVRAGSNLTLHCATRGHPTPVLSWLRNGRALTGKRKSKKYRQRRSRITIKSLEVADSGQYTCIAKNELGTLNFTYTIQVLESMPLKDIEVVAAPRDQTAHPGDTVIFHCRSEDYPKPKVYWIRKTDSKNIIEVVPTESTTNEELVMHDVSKSDSGIYTCSIGNDVVNKEFSARLNVIDEDEKLPFEPYCSLHIRHDHIVDYKTGCRTSEPVEMYYCMGSCGRSYYVPQVVMTDAPHTVTENGGHLNQTCRCCVGEVGALTLLEMDCPLGTRKRAFYQKLRDCTCQECSAGDTANKKTQTKTIKTNGD